MPLSRCGDSEPTMSRIPYGGFAVLDIAGSPRRKHEGARSKIDFVISFTGTMKRSLVRDTEASPIGLGDFDCPWDAWELCSCQQSADQIGSALLTPKTYRAPSRIRSAQKSANRSVASACVKYQRPAQQQGGVYRR